MGTLVKYHGRALAVPHSDSEYQLTLHKLLSLAQDLQASSQRDKEWQRFFEDLSAFCNRLTDPQSSVLRFQLDIANDCLLPYANRLKGRFYTDKARVHQLSSIIHALSMDCEASVHPAVCLLQLDRVRDEIRERQSYVWKSELLSMLDAALEKQWRPILLDARILLQDWAGKLFIAFLIISIGWPLALAYPLYANAQAMLRVVKDVKTHNRLSTESLLELAKVAAVAVVLLQIVNLLAAYQVVGNLCALLAIAAVGLSLNDAFLKHAVPIISPYAVVYDSHLQRWNDLSLFELVKELRGTFSTQFAAQLDRPEDPQLVIPSIDVPPDAHAEPNAKEPATTQGSAGEPQDDEDFVVVTDEHCEETKECMGIRLRKITQ